MSIDKLSDRAIIGRFFQRLEQERSNSWVPLVATKFDSDQAEERHTFLSAVPAFREWIGGRMVEGFVDTQIVVPNRHFESTLDFAVKDLRRDKTGQLDIRIAELAQRAAAHPQRLISDLLLAGQTSLCYDGQYFFDTDHAEGKSGAQSNIVDYIIGDSGIPLAQQGTPASPSAWALASAIAHAVMKFFQMRDDVGELMHHGAKSFMVMLPNTMLASSLDLFASEFAYGIANPLTRLPYKFTIGINQRLSWTDQFALFRSDGDVSSFIWQVETECRLKAKAEGTDYAFNFDRHSYGVDQWCNAAYGYWQNALLVRLD